jgi:hypothetical protein
MTERALTYPADRPRLPGHMRLGGRLPDLRPALLLVGSAAVALYSGHLISDGYGMLMLTGALGLAAAIGITVRPDVALLAWIGALFAWGRNLSHVAVGPIYVTEAFLALMTAAVVLRLLLAPQRRPGLKLTLAIVVMMWLPAVAGLALRTNFSDLGWMREFAIIHYSLFAVVGAALWTAPGFQRRLLRVALICALVGVVVPLVDGTTTVTSTGAERLAAGEYSIGYAAAMILIVAAVRERLFRRLALLGMVPLFFGLLVVNHRSAWLGFVVAVTLLLASRPNASSRLVLAAGATCLLLFLTTAYFVSPNSFVGDAVTRARTLDARDPNIGYRLKFWDAVAHASTSSPLIGSGFDRYPPEYVPPVSTEEEDHPAPHNSWVALAYRIGPIFALLVAGTLALLVTRATRLARLAADAWRRVALGGLAAVVVFLAIFAAFNVVLEVPYMAALFWLAVGFLAAETLRPTQTRHDHDVGLVGVTSPQTSKIHAARHAQ